jgi:hypothetical protein
MIKAPILLILCGSAFLVYIFLSGTTVGPVIWWLVGTVLVTFIVLAGLLVRSLRFISQIGIHTVSWLTDLRVALAEMHHRDPISQPLHRVQAIDLALVQYIDAVRSSSWTIRIMNLGVTSQGVFSLFSAVVTLLLSIAIRLASQ